MMVNGGFITFFYALQKVFKTFFETLQTDIKKDPVLLLEEIHDKRLGRNKPMKKLSG